MKHLPSMHPYPPVGAQRHSPATHSPKPLPAPQSLAQVSSSACWSERLRVVALIGGAHCASWLLGVDDTSRLLSESPAAEAVKDEGLAL